MAKVRGCGFLAAYRRAMAKVRRHGPKVSSRLATFCIHRVNRVNFRNDYSES